MQRNSLKIYYTIVVAIGAFHVHEGSHSAGLLILSFLIIIFSGLCVAASVFLLVGLSVDCKQMLLPWIVIILVTTLLDILYSILWLIETNSLEHKVQTHDLDTYTVLVIDITICAFNFYGVICVISQYQEFSQGRGTISYPPTNKNLLPPIEFGLTPLQNSKLKLKSSEKDFIDPKNVTIESICESDLLKVPKCADSSSGSSAVEDMSDETSLKTDILTINEESKNDFKNSLSESILNKNVNKEIRITMESTITV